MVITPPLCRAARALLSLDIAGLVKKSGVPASVITEFEKGGRIPQQLDLAAMRLAFEEAGIVFLEMDGDSPGLRLRKGARQSGMRPEQLSAENDD